MNNRMTVDLNFNPSYPEFYLLFRNLSFFTNDIHIYVYLDMKNIAFTSSDGDVHKYFLYILFIILNVGKSTT